MKIIRIIFLLLIFQTAMLAQDYAVTNIIKIKDKNFERVRIILNNFLVIENIKYFKDGAVELAYYESKDGDKFPQIEILDTLIEQEILNAIKNYQDKAYYPLNEPKFEIKDIFVIKKGARKANVELVIDNKFLIVLGIMNGKKGLWVTWPSSKKFDGKYHNDVYILNAKLKEKIENEVFKEYSKLEK